MDMPWDGVRLFLAIAEEGSVSGAARRLRMTQPTVTRRLRELEDAVGEALFRRSVRGTAVTAAGERLLAPARRMAEWAGEVGRVADRAGGGPQGLVRVTAPPLAAADFVAPFGAWLATREPALRLEVLSTTRYLDLARGEADLALRGRAPVQPELTVVHSVEVTSAPHAAPALAERLPRRPRPEQLPWIAWAAPHQDLPPNPQLAALAPGLVPTFTSDDILVQLAAAEAGAGVIVLPRIRHRFSRPTRLVPLQVDLGPHARQTLHLVAARSALDVPRIRRVADLMVAELKRVRVV